MCTVQDTIYVFANRRIRDLSYVNVGTLFYKVYNLIIHPKMNTYVPHSQIGSKPTKGKKWRIY